MTNKNALEIFIYDILERHPTHLNQNLPWKQWKPNLQIWPIDPDLVKSNNRKLFTDNLIPDEYLYDWMGINIGGYEKFLHPLFLERGEENKKKRIFFKNYEGLKNWDKDFGELVEGEPLSMVFNLFELDDEKRPTSSQNENILYRPSKWAWPPLEPINDLVSSGKIQYKMVTREQYGFGQEKEKKSNSPEKSDYEYDYILLPTPKHAKFKYTEYANNEHYFRNFTTIFYMYE